MNESEDGMMVALDEMEDGEIIVIRQIEDGFITDEVWINRPQAIEMAREIISMAGETLD